MTQSLNLSLEFAAATDIGCKRGNNEDSFGYDADQNLYVVCDGMGGRAAGEVASATAVRVLIETFESKANDASVDGSPVGIEMRLLESIREANHAVRTTALSDLEFSGMGTTLVCACVEGDQVLVANVGDSRAYLIREGAAMQITMDHSLLDEQVRQGVLTPEMAAASSMQSVITRAIGVADTVEPDFYAAELKSGDLLLLASDGLTRYVGDQEIAAITQEAQELHAVCQGLIDAAKGRGGADNITCMLLRAGASGPEPGEMTAEDASPTL